MKKAKTEVLEALKNAEDLTEKEFTALIESVSGIYSTFANATKGEVADFKKEMHAHWKEMQKNGAVQKAKKAIVKHVSGSAKPAKKKVKRAKKASGKAHKQTS